ncbi:hypothetical protein PENSPDRAFT_501176 [Peniophora sp. CONT]|nr:hypothetical protein PENSPDRAFT_501176 [Peniophora sp. CONT]
MAPAPHTVYSQELSRSFRRGHPIANPQPIDYDGDGDGVLRNQEAQDEQPQLRPVEVGDVGYIQPELGFFNRLFNVHLEPGVDGQPTRDRLPDDFVPLPRNTIRRTTDNIPLFMSETVTTKQLKAEATGPFFGGFAEFSTSGKRGAVLATPDPIECYSAVHILDYKIYAKLNLETWHNFARARGHDVALEALILVTGVDRTTSWATAVAIDNKAGAGFGLRVQFAPAGGIELACRYLWQSAIGVLVSSGPIPRSTVSSGLASPNTSRSAVLPVGSDRSTSAPIVPLDRDSEYRVRQ